MFNKYFSIPLATVASFLFAMPTCSANQYSIVIDINTAQSISGQPLKIKSVSWSPGFTGGLRDDRLEFWINFPNLYTNGNAADFVVAPEGNSPYSCLIHVTTYPNPHRADVNIEVDSTQCSGIFYAVPVYNPNGNCLWPPKVCYLLNFYTGALKKR
jgi:hypothetical protein